MRPRGVPGIVAALFGTVLLVGALPVAADAASCPETKLVQPFAKIEERERRTPGYYSLVAGGDFEAGEAAWTLSGGAKVSAGGAKNPLTEVEGKSSLDLPKGAVATSPITCVEPNDRTFRFLARDEGGEAILLVSVVYESSEGNKVHQVGTLMLGSAGWGTSPILETKVERASEISSGVAHMSLRFTAAKGTARIDDVYLDPRMRR
jgi:hypothetical protein